MTPAAPRLWSSELSRSPATRRRGLERDGRAYVVSGSTENMRGHLVRVAARRGEHRGNCVSLCDDCYLDVHRSREDAETEETGRPDR